MTITVKYSCDGCGLKRVEADVPARTTEDVVVWMDRTVRLLSRDHARRSPGCHPKALQEVMIPIGAGVDRIGGPVTH